MFLPRRPARGFTLLETLVSLVMVSMLVMVVYNLLPLAFVATRQAGRETQADALATSLLEEYRAKPFSHLVPGTLRPDAVTVGGTTYLPVIRVSQPTGPGAGRLRHLEVEVSWTHGNRAHSARYSLDVVDLPR